jgi:hypothetical protein
MLILFIIVLFVVTGALFTFAKWRDLRAGRLMDGEWVVATALADSVLRELVVERMKGRDPEARVRRRGTGFERQFEDASGNMRNSSTLAVWLEHGDDGLTEVHCEIADWEGPTKFGLRMVTSVNLCASSIRAIVADIRRADPSAELVSKPGGK